MAKSIEDATAKEKGTAKLNLKPEPAVQPVEVDSDGSEYAASTSAFEDSGLDDVDLSASLNKPLKQSRHKQPQNRGSHQKRRGGSRRTDRQDKKEIKFVLRVQDRIDITIARPVIAVGDNKKDLTSYHGQVVKSILHKHGMFRDDELQDLADFTTEHMNKNSFGKATCLSNWGGYGSIVKKLIEDLHYAIVNRVDRCPSAVLLLEVEAALEVSPMIRDEKCNLAEVWKHCRLSELLLTAAGA